MANINKQSFKVCCCFERIFRFMAAEPPEDIKKIFDKYAENSIMSLDGLHRFLVEFQGESEATKEDAQAIFNSLKHLNMFQRKGLHFDAFFRYLFGDLNPPIFSEVNHNMKAPLAHYFLYTGHNSYLTGNQLSSNSSVKPIIQALQRGVRVIELDLWPNSKKNGVAVLHGGTLTRPVELIKCLRAIKDNAFTASEYPVVITFEDHLTSPLQAKVAKDNDEDDRDEDEENADLQYKQLIAIHAGKPKGGLDMLHIDPKKVRRLSLSEQQLERASKTRGTDIVRFTQRNLLRIYPKGTRVDSSNYDPMLGWSHGAQMVAFNMQGHDKHLHIMEGMFRANGGCGYVKKPKFLLTGSPDNEVFNPEKSYRVRQILKVKVYMGEGWHSDFHRTHFDLFSPPDFFVRVGIAGVPTDTLMEETKTIEDEWIPVWNQEFNFPLSVPELAVLRIEVKEYDSSGNHDFGGQICLPISELRTGFRAVPLHDKKGVRYKSVKLLMKFEFESPE
ncbi:phosphoinositide phospholipase C 2-like isoform X2 [Rosa rugosa]|uniref:phosphoinositide phospholipase C 2-like isoform X2 n=1 Tax=Rosa rugosa TaxID=74645 RepID=UPI002B41803F|nr:phosphoinositide phospholipase C 2-like isoform X2 [Rosa rugosa]